MENLCQVWQRANVEIAFSAGCITFVSRRFDDFCMRGFTGFGDCEITTLWLALHLQVDCQAFYLALNRLHVCVSVESLLPSISSLRFIRFSSFSSFMQCIRCTCCTRYVRVLRLFASNCSRRFLRLLLPCRVCLYLLWWRGLKTDTGASGQMKSSR